MPFLRTARTSALAAGLLMAGAAGALATTYAEPSRTGQTFEQSYVTANVNLRAGPGTSHRVVAKLRRGDFVNVGECRGSWCRVEAGGKPNGWVSGRFIGRGENPYHDLGPAGPGIPPQEPGTYR